MTAKKRGIQLKQQVRSDDPGLSELLGEAAKGLPVVPPPPSVSHSPVDASALHQLAREIRQELEETLEILKRAVAEGTASIRVAVAEAEDRRSEEYQRF
jgi:hypothetical protein